MNVNSEVNGAQWVNSSDPRITRLGHFLRLTRIDELPQLWSVLTGEMSLIGPRPERPEFDSFLSGSIPHYNLRYLMRPGLSGWAQVNYPYGASVLDSTNKLSYDIYYIRNFSFWLDFLIFFKTIRLVFRAKGAIPGAIPGPS
jgi:lipopolysaccharide/colanic/teichoic acid biosynthesis glycosyltransferase